MRALLLVSAAIAAGAGSYGVTLSPLLDVDTVHVRGAARTSTAEVLEASGLDRRPPMTSVNATRIERAIERLPWVQSARVTRRWPGSVDVTLLERTPLAVGPARRDRWAVLDPTGRVLAHEDAPPPGLTRLELTRRAGPPATRVGPAARGALLIIESLPEALSARVPRIRVASDGVLELFLDDKVTVRFGTTDDARAKLVALTTVVQKADLARVTSIDVRAPTAPVLTRR